MGMHWLPLGLAAAASMLWQMGWALVLGFALSGALQAFVTKERMAQLLGGSGWRAVGLATGLGAASSSCSYAAVATGNTIFRKGAGFGPTLAFMLASTNLVIELGFVLWIALGWRFVAAEVMGAVVMIAIMEVLVRLTWRADLESAARTHAHNPGEAGMAAAAMAGPSPDRWRTMADTFCMDVSMLWKEVLIGVLVAGFLMVCVPAAWWQHLFIAHSAIGLRLAENAFVGPLAASAAFVCSVGNIPLAALLWSSGCGFGGVIAFIYGDLIIPPLISAYRTYYGAKTAVYITVVFYVSMVGAGIAVELVFRACGLIPPHPLSHAMAMAEAGLTWNYTTWLDLAALALAGSLLVLHLRRQHA